MPLEPPCSDRALARLTLWSRSNPCPTGAKRLRTSHQPYWVGQRRQPVKEIGLFELLFRNAARFAAVSGVIALLVWLTWVMLDVGHMQSGFTLPY